MISTYTSYLTFERNYGRPLPPVDTSSIDPNGSLATEAEYFRQNIGKVSNGAELASDDRLFRYAITAFGLSDQVENKDFIVRVLDEGVFDPFVPLTRDDREAGRDDNPINKAAEAFWFGDDFVLPSTKDAKIEKVITSYQARLRDFALQSPSNALKVQEEVDFFRKWVGTLQTGEQLVNTERLYTFVVRAFGLEEDYGNRNLIGKALDAGVYNPGAGQLKTGSLANTLNDSRYAALARGFAFNEIGDKNTKNEKFVETLINNHNTQALKERARAERADSSRQTPLDKSYQREIAYFRENIGKVSNAEELLADERLYRFMLTAYDLESSIPSRALVKKVLDQGIEDPKALANQLVDQKFKGFARSVGFAEVGDRNVRNPNFADEVIERFKRVKLESDAGEENLGVRLAAYFDRKAVNLKSWFTVLGDKAMREVVFTAFDLPDAMQTTNPDKLVSIFEKRMDIEDLSDPVKRKKFIQRFAVMYDVKNGSPGGGGSSLLSLYGILPDAGGGGGNGIVAIDPATRGAVFG